MHEGIVALKTFELLYYSIMEIQTFTHKNCISSFNSNKATYHFIVIVGKGYDRNARKHYFRYYDVNTLNRSDATNESNKLYIEKAQRLIQGARGNERTYTITEVRKNI